MSINENVEIITKGGLLTQDQAVLLRQAVYLLEREKSIINQESVFDYGFLVFTTAKVYEGFLKSFFYQLGLISGKQYHDEHLRIGKALNPDLPNKFRNETWLYDDLCGVCGAQTARKLWETWKKGRNQIFHYFPEKEGLMTLLQAEAVIFDLLESMKVALDCEVKIKREG